MKQRWVSSPRRRAPLALLVGCAAAFCTALARAAGTASSVLAQVQSGDQSVVQQAPSGSHVGDVIIFVVLVAAALFVICRSSRRS